MSQINLHHLFARSIEIHHQETLGLTGLSVSFDPNNGWTIGGRKPEAIKDMMLRIAQEQENIGFNTSISDISPHPIDKDYYEGHISIHYNGITIGEYPIPDRKSP